MESRVMEFGVTDTERMPECEGLRFYLRRLSIPVVSTGWRFSVSTVCCAMVIVLILLIGGESSAEPEPGEAAVASDRSEDSSGEKSEQTEGTSVGVEETTSSNVTESDAEVTTDELRQILDESHPPDGDVDVDSVFPERAAMEAYLAGDSSEHSDISINELDSVGGWSFYAVTQSADSSSSVSVFAVRDGDSTITYGGPEQLGRIYESLGLFDGDDLPEEQILTAAEYLVSRSLGEEIVTSTGDEVSEEVQRHFPNVELEAPRFQRRHDGVTIQYLTFGALPSGGLIGHQLLRYELTVSKDYDVEVDYDVVRVIDSASDGPYTPEASPRPESIEFDMNTTVDISDDHSYHGDLRTTLRRGRSAVEACYEAALEKSLEAGTKIDVQLTIDRVRGGGWRIVDAKVISDTVEGDAAVCVAGSLKSMRVPPPADGKALEAVVTYEFAPETEE